MRGAKTLLAANTAVCMCCLNLSEIGMVRGGFGADATVEMLWINGPHSYFMGRTPFARYMIAEIREIDDDIPQTNQIARS